MPRPAASTGYTYIGLLLLVALMGVSLSVVGQVWHTKQKRDREDELLFIGNEFRRAIGYYYVSTPGGAARFPRSLEDLLKDPRVPGVRRYLRRIYRDPMTGKKEWGLVKMGEFITGVHSLSEEAPLKKRGFRPADRRFEDKDRYADWIFFSQFDRRQAVKAAGGAGAPSGAIK